MQVYKFNVPTFGKDVVFDVSHKVRAEQFKMFSEGLKISKMTDYVPLFVQEAEASLSSHDLVGIADRVLSSDKRMYLSIILSGPCQGP